MDMADRSKTVERTKLIELVEDRLTKVADAASAQRQTVALKPLINIYGITGIGKTTLLDQIRDHLQQRYHVVFLSFDRTFGESADWGAALDALAGLPQLAELQRPLPPPPAELHELLNEVSAPSAHADPGQQGLLLIDGLDDNRLAKWLGSEVIEPLIEDPSTAVVVYMSQAQVRWDWPLDNAVEALELETFSRAEAQELLALHNLGDRQPLVDAVYEFSQGYPLALLGIIEERQREQSRRANDLHKQRVDLDEVADLLEIEGLTPERKALTVSYITALRYLEVPVMQQLLIDVSGLPERRDKTMGRVRSLNRFIGALRERELTKRYRSDLPEQFIEPLRTAALSHRLAEQEHSAQKIAKKLAQIYYRQAYDQPKSSAIYTLEYLLFAATALIEDPAQSELTKTLERIEKLFQRIESVLRNSPDAQTSQRYPLPLLFYRDDQLIELLRKIVLWDDPDANLFAFIDRRIGRLLEVITEQLANEPGPSGLYRTPLPEYERSLLKVLASLEDRVPLQLAEKDLPADGRLTGRMIQRLVFRFSHQTMQEYRQVCREDALLTPMVVTVLLNTFAERGVIDFDAQRQYRPTKILSHMWETLAPRTLAEASIYER